ncbi:FtsX-like permease family protein [Actinoplanes sp. NPDC051861]|uniref:FtsX-like permease family protein n=1 Tax=Actinoplanes sp. NPDC051861 TaxID=3155170 RepID=UPI00344709E5
MGRVVLVVRLALRDLRRRRAEAVLLLVAVLAATTTLTLGLVLRDAAADPYQRTRELTSGPDVVAFGDAGTLGALAASAGVVGSSGPYPVAGAELGTATGRASDVQVIGRESTAAAVDQPSIVDGGWVRDGGVVLEAAFAGALGVTAGDTVTIDGRAFEVAGTAVTAAMAPYPEFTCMLMTGCAGGMTDAKKAGLPPDMVVDPGLVWMASGDVPSSSAYVINLRLDEPSRAAAFVSADRGIGLMTWEEIRAESGAVARDAQILLLIGAWLLGVLAIASLAVLAGGRMADQTRRAGLIKAVGGTPAVVAVVLLAEYVLVALVAAGLGLAGGTLIAPLLGLGTPSLDLPTVAAVIAVALAVTVGATVIPAVRAARSSTVEALADASRAPRRVSWMISVSSRLPVPLLLALRVTARRPRRAVLAGVSIAVTVSGIFFALVLNDFLNSIVHAALLPRVLLVVMIVLACLAAVNAVVVTWTTVIDNRRPSALARALGATPREVSLALGAAQVLPATVGALIGAGPGGLLLFYAIMAVTGGDGSRATLPAFWQLLVLVVVTVLVVAGLTVIPARLGGGRPVAESLRA